MKRAFTTILIISSTYAFSQTERIEDKRTQPEKEDSVDLYKQSKISTLDLLEALDLASIRIFKFDIGEFKKEYKLRIFADEYANGKVVKSDTLINFKNDYGFWIDGKYNQGFLDQIKVFTKTEENFSTLKISTYAMSTKKEINLHKKSPSQSFHWREYTDTNWELNKKIPLMIFASSWFDKEHKFYRFCGVVNLSQNDERTDELLNYSPNYTVISYEISE